MVSVHSEVLFTWGINTTAGSVQLLPPDSESDKQINDNKGPSAQLSLIQVSVWMWHLVLFLQKFSMKQLKDESKWSEINKSQSQKKKIQWLIVFSHWAAELRCNSPVRLQTKRSTNT